MATRMLTPEELKLLNQLGTSGYSGTVAKPSGMAQDEYDWLMNQQRAVSGVPAYAPAYPDLPRYTPSAFKAPKYNIIDFNKALTQAQTQLRPEWEASRTSVGTINQQQLAQLRQALNARGMLDAGALAEGMKGLNANLNQALTGLDTAYRTNAAKMAQDIVAQDEARKQWLAQQAFQAWQAQEALKAQAAGMAMDDYWKQVAQQNWAKQFAADEGWKQKQFDYQASRDQVLDDRWMQQFNYQQRRDLIDDAYRNRQISLQEKNYLLDKYRAEKSTAGETGNNNIFSLSQYVNRVEKMLNEKMVVPTKHGPEERNKYTIADIMDYLAKQNLTPAEIAQILNALGIDLASLNRDYVNVKPR